MKILLTDALRSGGNACRFESQYLRRVFSEAIGNATEWNWREHMKPEITVATYEVLNPLCQHS